MNNQELEHRNKKLERRWKITLVVAVLFLISRPLAVYITDHLIHRSINHQLENYNLLDPARQFVSQDDYILNIQSLRDYFSSLSTKYPDNVSVYYEQLNSGANAGVNQNARLFPASLTKLPLAIVVARKVEDKTWNWNTKFTIQQSDIDSGSGDLYKKVKAGDSMTVDDLLSAMIINSDNTAQEVFLRNVTQTDLNNFVSEVGLESLFDDQGLISSKEYSRVLRVLWTSDYLERYDSQKILELMAKDSFHDFLSQGLPPETTFAHKWGENRDQSIFADSGIVYQDHKPYMITVILKGKDSTEASRTWAVGLMKEISQKAIAQDQKN